MMMLDGEDGNEMKAANEWRRQKKTGKITDEMKENVEATELIVI